MQKILVVEDNAPLCWLIERMLRGKYVVVVMNNGLEAMSWIQDGNKCDLIISDINMPEINGLDLLNMIKSSGLHSETPVIMLSALEEGLKIASELGASACFLKPFNPQQLLQSVGSLVSKQHSSIAA